MTVTHPAGESLTSEQLEFFETEGYLVVRGLIGRDEAQQWREYFMGLHAAGEVPGYFSPKKAEDAGGDQLRMYPRMLMPHVWDQTVRGYTVDPRFYPILRDLLADEPIAMQSMLYFKPPGARGQALHQDNYYLQVSPGTCLALWLSLDDADAQNGGLSVVPGSHRLPILCPHPADLDKSFTIEEVDVPEGLEPVAIELNVGDALFFNGSVIHGSGPNVTADRFRRSFICHYIPAKAEYVSSWNQLIDFEGQDVKRHAPTQGGPCGTDEIELMRRAVLAQEDKARAGREQGAL